MKISHLGLEAFITTAQTLNITQASKQLGLTQSALSQRIAQLESDLETTLFVRESRGLLLTESGEKLLRFGKLNEKMESELLLELKGSDKELAGVIRIAAYSSILRSVIIPALTPFMTKNPKVQVHLQSYEMGDLERVLETANADIILMDYRWSKKGIVSDQVGEEEFVVIESKKAQAPEGVFLDHGPNDNATISFFQNISKTPKLLKRSFMGDVYGIIDGVELGLGKAVMSKHLVNDNKKLKIVKNYAGQKRPVTMYYFESPYYSKLMKEVVAIINQRAKDYL